MEKVINGFVRRSGKQLINDAGKFIMRGWGIGNWLVPEGYMWLYEKSPRMDRPRRIEAVIREVIGTKEAEKFWQTYRENYFTEVDVRRIKRAGYNSIRLPINARLFMKEEPELSFLSEGFERLDEAVAWCLENDLYLWIDLHAAPGGQTGANIDDSIDDLPRLFMDEAAFEKGLALWEKIAARYANNPVVAGYDLLNEPIRPEDPAQGIGNCDALLPELIRFYEEAIARIRKVDQAHCISLEGHHWATDTTLFDHLYDENCVIQFHRYWDAPFEEIFEPFLKLQEKFDVPLWLGETGENSLKWFAAISSLCERKGISYHFWPYKKMGKANCSVGIAEPEGWQELINYAKGGKKPDFANAQAILQAFLENLKVEKGILHDATDHAILRNGSYEIMGTNRVREAFEVEKTVEVRTDQQSKFLWMNRDLLLEAGMRVHYLAPRFTAGRLVVSGKGIIEVVGERDDLTSKAALRWQEPAALIEIRALSEVQIEKVAFLADEEGKYAGK